MPRPSWGDARKIQLESILLKSDWIFKQQFKESTLYQKENYQIEVDEFGIFLFKKNDDGNWKRIAGLAGDNINKSFISDQSHFILQFDRNGRIQLFDLGEIND